MKKLSIEELESRNLLSASGFGHLVSHGGASNRPNNESFISSSRSSFDMSGLERLENVHNAGPSRIDMGAGAFNFEPVGSMIVESFEIVVLVPMQATESNNFLDGPVFRSSLIRQASSSSVNLSAASLSLPLALTVPNTQRLTGETSDATLIATAENSFTNINPVETSSALAANKNGTQPAGRIDVAVIGTAGRNMDGAPFATGSGTKANPASGSGFEGPTGPAPIPPAMPRLPDLEYLPSPLVQSIHVSLASLPQFAGMVNGISTVSLERVEQGIASFLGSLDGTPVAALPGSNSDFYPWLLAGVVTAVACELARRQFKKPALTNPFELVTNPPAPWEMPLEH